MRTFSITYKVGIDVRTFEHSSRRSTDAVKALVQHLGYSPEIVGVSMVDRRGRS